MAVSVNRNQLQIVYALLSIKTETVISEFHILSGDKIVRYISQSPSGRAVYGVGLRPLDYFDRGFESR
jgi:hypothetical protein